MRFPAIVFTAVLLGGPGVAAAQLTADQQAALTPAQVVDAPKDAIGARVTWTVRYHHMYADVQADGKVAHSRIAYEWRDPFGLSAPILIIGPALEDTRFTGPAGSAIVLQAEPRLLKGTVRGVAPSSGVDGKGGTAVIVDDVTISPADQGAHAAVGSHAFVFGQGQMVGGGGAYAPGAGVSWPVVLKETKPAYPTDAIPSKKEGTVELELIIGADGKVSDVRVTKSLDNGGEFDKAAIAAAKEWLFKPGAKEGKPVPTKVSLVLDFKVKK